MTVLAITNPIYKFNRKWTLNQENLTVKPKFSSTMGCKGYEALLFFCLAALTASFAQAIEVKDDVEIQVVENGTVEAIVLDCPYDLGEADLGLVINWLQDNNPIPVYQWIEGEKPQGLGILEGRLDLGYEASDEPFHQYRALRILKPTTELSGDYQCRISSFDDEKNVFRKLIVYNKPDSIRMWTEEEGEKNLKVVCEVDDIFPEPEVKLHMMTNEDGDRVILEGAKEEKTWSNGLYKARVELTMEEDSVDGPTYFECDVTIPNTEVEVTNTTYYEPRVQETAGAVTSGSEARSALAVWVSLAFLSLWRI